VFYLKYIIIQTYRSGVGRRYLYIYIYIMCVGYRIYRPRRSRYMSYVRLGNIIEGNVSLIQKCMFPLNYNIKYRYVFGVKLT